MELVKVNSSNLEFIGYNKQRNLLLVQFKKGIAYEYYEVPEEVYDKFLELRTNAESVGKYFNHAIKGVYKYARTTIREN